MLVFKLIYRVYNLWLVLPAQAEPNQVRENVIKIIRIIYIA